MRKIMQGIKRFCLFVLPVAILGFGLSACETRDLDLKWPDLSSSSSAAQTGAASPAPKAKAAQTASAVKIGLLLPLSGAHARLGSAMLQSAQMALFDMGNANIQLIPRDTGESEAGAAKAAQEVIAEGAQLILGPVFSASLRAVKPVAGRAHINVISFSTDWEQAGGNIFILGFLPFDQVARVTDYAAAHQVESLGLLTPDNAYGRAVAASYQAALKRTGLRNLIALDYPAEAKAGDAALAEAARRFSIAAEPADPGKAVLIPAAGAQAAALSDLLARNGLPGSQMRRVGTGLYDEAGLAAAPSLDGAWFAAPAPESRAGFENRFRQNYGVAPPRLASLAYDATALASVLAQGASANGGGTDIYGRAALMNSNGFSGIDGIFRFKPDGRAERGLAVLQYRNGKIVTIDPPASTFQSAPF